MEIKDKIIEILSVHCDMENVNQYLHENDDLTKLGLNSISFIKMVVNLESEFQFEFEDEALDYNKFTSLKLLCSYVEEQMKINNVEYLPKEIKIDESAIKEWLFKKINELVGTSILHNSEINDLTTLNIPLGDAQQLVDNINEKFDVFLDENIIINERLFIIENLCKYICEKVNKL